MLDRVLILQLLLEARIHHAFRLMEYVKVLTQELLKRVDISGAILEPCAGNSAITEALKTYSGKITTVTESDLTWADTRYHSTDATSKEFWDYWRSHFWSNYPNCGLSWVVTNPPFSQAHSILPHAFSACNVGVAFLLRSTYCEPCKNRADWLISHADKMRYRIDINPRPQFRSEKGTDSATCTWFVWLKDWSWRDRGIEPPFQFIIDWR